MANAIPMNTYLSWTWIFPAIFPVLYYLNSYFSGGAKNYSRWKTPKNTIWKLTHEKNWMQERIWFHLKELGFQPRETRASATMHHQFRKRRCIAKYQLLIECESTSPALRLHVILTIYVAGAISSTRTSVSISTPLACDHTRFVGYSISVSDVPCWIATWDLLLASPLLPIECVEPCTKRFPESTRAWSPGYNMSKLGGSEGLEAE